MTPLASGKLGYETRSWLGAFVMLLGDHLRFWHRPTPFAWKDDAVVSSLGGLGDFIIQLPLIAALKQKADAEGRHLRIAVRPALAPLVEHLGWPVIRLENPVLLALQNGFFSPAWKTCARQLQHLKREAIPLWVDLTGHVVTAVLVKSLRVKRLAARTSNGGASFIDHPLPHIPYRNEYETPQELARFFGVETDFSIYQKLRLHPQAVRNDSIVLAISSARWRAWPLAYFAELIETLDEILPDSKFILIGRSEELLPEELPLLSFLATKPNVRNAVDQFSLLDMVECIATARAIVTPEGGPQHVAQAFHTPGVVVFGPVSPEVWTPPQQTDLTVLHDTQCPLYPCHYQMGCKRPEQWCMKKITPSEVRSALLEILQPCL